MNNQSVVDKLKETFIPSILTGAIGAGAYYFMYNQPGMMSMKVPFGPIELNPIFAVAGSAMVGNLVGETATHFILPYVQSYGTVAHEELIVPPVLSGISTYLAARFMVSENAEILPTFLIGGGSSVASKYIYGMIEPKSLSN